MEPKSAKEKTNKLWFRIQRTRLVGTAKSFQKEASLPLSRCPARPCDSHIPRTRPNFPKKFDGEAFKVFENYFLDDEVQIWQREGIHHPFAKYCPRIMYHQRLADIFGRTEHKERLASHVCFVELLDVPTVGRSSRHASRFESLLNPEHLRWIESLVFSRQRCVSTFVSSGVLKKIRRLGSAGSTAFGPLRETEFPRERGCPDRICHSGDAHVYAMVHPTRLCFLNKSLREDYMNRLAKRIDSCVERRSG